MWIVSEKDAGVIGLARLNQHHSAQFSGCGNFVLQKMAGLYRNAIMDVSFLPLFL